MSERAAAPDFVGVGTNKSGTTWWHRLISLHPRVHLGAGRAKELHHFDPFWERPFTDADVAGYHERCARPDGMVVGEWTPRYAADPWVAPLLHRAAPDALWLFLVRDPWQRFVSELAAELSRPQRSARARLPDLVLARARYGEQLERLRSEHPAERILVLQYERCVREPAEMLTRTYAAMGLDPVLPPDAELRRRVNAADGERPELSDELRVGVMATLAEDLERFHGLAGDAIDRSLWPSTAAAAT